MKRFIRSLAMVVFVLAAFFASSAGQVDRIVIPAGTPEDHELQTISSEQDPQKKLAMYLEFVQKYSGNPAAVAYGNWQISQAYQPTDLQKALEYGDRALAGAPHSIDILVSQATLAQQAKDNAKLMDYAARGGEVCQSIGKQSKPAGMSDEDFAHQIAEEKSAIQGNCDYLETSGFNVITTENDPKTRMAYVERFSTAFPDSKFQEAVASYAMDSLSQLNDNARLVAYGEKMLAANPNSLPALLLLANFYSNDAKAGSTGKAVTYSQKAIEAAKADAPDADKSHKVSGGVAHSILGFAYMKQDKTTTAIPELKKAAALLKGQDDQQYVVALYRLGFAYAKLSKTTEARDVLTEAVKFPGPMQAMCQDLLSKVNAARAKGK